MKQQIEQLKKEIQEWAEPESRNISPTMAKMLLVAVDGLDTALLNAMAGWTDFSKLNAASPDYDRNYKPEYGKDVEVIEDSINEILSIWEGSKR